MPPILSKFNRFKLEDGFIKHAQLAVFVGAGQTCAEVHGEEVAGQGGNSSGGTSAPSELAILKALLNDEAPPKTIITGVSNTSRNT